MADKVVAPVQNAPKDTTLGFVDKDQNPVTPDSFRVNVLSMDQFEDFLAELRKSIIYAAVLQGFVNNKPGATPSAANMRTVKALADAALELMEE